MNPAAGKAVAGGDDMGLLLVDAAPSEARRFRWVRIVVACGCLTAAMALCAMFVLSGDTEMAECQGGCVVLTDAEALALRALPADMLVTSVAQVLAALAAQVATGRLRRGLTFLALVVTAANTWLSFSLFSVLSVVMSRHFGTLVGLGYAAAAIGIGVAAGCFAFPFFYGDE